MEKKLLLWIGFMGWTCLSLAQNQVIQWQHTIPSVSTFSSPRVIDLNGDSIQDVVIGAGLEGLPTPAGIFAFDGNDGSILWQRYARDQVYGSPIFQDITGEGTPDVFITGRDAQFYALNGETGFEIWQFWPDTLSGSSLDSNWYNFYLPQWIPDQNRDGYRDILVSNGGDPRIVPADKNRSPGYLMALSGLDGSILRVDTMPDGQETYHSPLLVDFLQNGEWDILFGSGGETIGGSFSRVSLTEFMSNGLSNATPLLSDTTEGYIAVPSLADLNQDGVPDIIVPQLNAAIVALDGRTGQEIWRHTEAGADCYVSPTIGQFTGNATPDIFVLAAVGNWPFYQQSIKLLLDGSNGQVVWSEADYPFQMTSGNAIDWDGDGYDEVIYPKNQDIGIGSGHLVNQFFCYDFNDQLIQSFDVQREGVMVFSMPLITDLEQDQSLEMIFATHDNPLDWYDPDGFTLHRMNLNLYQDSIAWAGYQGTGGDGTYPMNLQVSVDFPEESPLLQVYPNPVRQLLFFHALGAQEIDRIEIWDSQGKQVRSADDQEVIEVNDLSPGLYAYRVYMGDQIAGGTILVQ